MKAIQIKNYRFNFQREPLAKPFQFKGSSFREKWTLVLEVESTLGTRSTGTGGTAVLWSDPAVFSAFSEAGGNVVMAAMAEKGAQLAVGRSFQNPIELLETILPQVHDFGVQLTGNRNLKKTFTLNSLVALDLALWKLLVREAGLADFGQMIPEEFRPALGHRLSRIARLPVVSYDCSLEELFRLAEQGHFFLKIKVGQAGSTEEMIKKDQTRLEEIHQAFQGKKAPRSPVGKFLYYLDFNGRYPDRASLKKLIDYADRIGMLDQIALVEEPFPKEALEDVSDFPVRIAADESVEDEVQVMERINLGYKAIAIKPAGKTLSMSLKMIRAAHRRGMTCFVADNACIPLLVEWNKNIAARLGPFPGLDAGIMESNGEQNYRDWGKMVLDHPLCGSGWIKPREGFFHLDEEFYRTSGGIFLEHSHYQKLISD
ncbi:MAG: mandelate racemase/muconate lactonizing enzyme family protein [Syntrophaceae bacterium]|nr:mandelate racemase/muconate lactonizing enzyme family protein [Syntrophaceae bacterium]